MGLSLAVCASRGFSHFVRPFGCAGGFEAARGASSVLRGVGIRVLVRF